MTVITLIVARNVGCMFAESGRAVVATCTVSNHLRVIDLCFGRPELDGVAGFALTGGIDMTGALPDGDGAVMTVRTVGRNACVTEGSRFPRRG